MALSETRSSAPRALSCVATYRGLLVNELQCSFVSLLLIPYNFGLGRVFLSSVLQ